ncbi:unnamed protein product [Choristocarpus tenellus]
MSGMSGTSTVTSYPTGMPSGSLGSSGWYMPQSQASYGGASTGAFRNPIVTKSPQSTSTEIMGHTVAVRPSAGTGNGTQSVAQSSQVSGVNPAVGGSLPGSVIGANGASTVVPGQWTPSLDGRVGSMGGMAPHGGWYPYASPGPLYPYGVPESYGLSMDASGVPSQAIPMTPRWQAQFAAPAMTSGQQRPSYLETMERNVVLHQPGSAQSLSHALHPMTVQQPTAHYSAPDGVPTHPDQGETCEKDTLDEEGVGSKSGEGDVFDVNGKRRRLTAEERLQRSRERNRLHARKTRQRKKIQLQLLQRRTAELHKEQQRLQQVVRDRRTAGILLGLSGGEGSQHNEGGALSQSPINLSALAGRQQGTSESDETESRSGEGSSKDEMDSTSSIAGTRSTTSSGSGRTSSETNSSDSGNGTSSVYEGDAESKGDASQGGRGGDERYLQGEGGDDDQDLEGTRVGRLGDSKRLRELASKDRSECTAEEIEEIRRERNRMHAKRTRDRKKLYLEATEGTIARLEQENCKLRESIDSMSTSVTQLGSPAVSSTASTHPVQQGVHLLDKNSATPGACVPQMQPHQHVPHHPHFQQHGHPQPHGHSHPHPHHSSGVIHPHLHSAAHSPPPPGYYPYGMASVPVKQVLPMYMHGGIGFPPHGHMPVGINHAHVQPQQPSMPLQYMQLPPRIPMDKRVVGIGADAGVGAGTGASGVMPGWSQHTSLDSRFWGTADQQSATVNAHVSSMSSAAKSDVDCSAQGTDKGVVGATVPEKASAVVKTKRAQMMERSVSNNSLMLQGMKNVSSSQVWEMKDGRISRKRRRPTAKEGRGGEVGGRGLQGGRNGGDSRSEWEDEASECSSGGDSSISSIEPGSNSSQTRDLNGDSGSASSEGGDSRDDVFGDEINSTENNSGEEDEVVERRGARADDNDGDCGDGAIRGGGGGGGNERGDERNICVSTDIVKDGGPVKEKEKDSGSKCESPEGQSRCSVLE